MVVAREVGVVVAKEGVVVAREVGVVVAREVGVVVARKVGVVVAREVVVVAVREVGREGAVSGGSRNRELGPWPPAPSQRRSRAVRAGGRRPESRPGGAGSWVEVQLVGGNLQVYQLFMLPFDNNGVGMGNEGGNH